MMSLHHQDFSGSALASELLFFQNYGPALWNHTWSPAVEEHFYLLLALGAFVLARRRSPRPFAPIPGVFIALAVLCLILRVLKSWHSPYSHQTHLVLLVIFAVSGLPLLRRPSFLSLSSTFDRVRRAGPAMAVSADGSRRAFAGSGVLLSLGKHPLHLHLRVDRVLPWERLSLGVGALGFGALDEPLEPGGRRRRFSPHHSFYLGHAAARARGTAFVHDLLLPHQSLVLQSLRRDLSRRLRCRGRRHGRPHRVSRASTAGSSLSIARAADGNRGQRGQGCAPGTSFHDTA